MFTWNHFPQLKGTTDSHKDPVDWDRIFMGEITVLKKSLHKEICEIVLELPSVSPGQRERNHILVPRATRLNLQPTTASNCLLFHRTCAST